MKIKKVAIFGYADLSEDDPLYQEAFEAAKVLAQAGYTIVDGGGPGIMKAATLGAKAGGGKAIGVTFYPRKVFGVSEFGHFEGRDQTNLIDEEIVAQSYIERTLKLLELGDVYVIFKGGTGTVSEFGMAWGLARIRFGRHKPFLLYGSFWHEITEAIAKNMIIRDEALRVYEIVDSPEAVLEEIKELEAGN